MEMKTVTTCPQCGEKAKIDTWNLNMKKGRTPIVAQNIKCLKCGNIFTFEPFS